ncbi:MAG: hypothetical protein ACFE0I_25275 [Elainellaceae cyanobacterium]
MTSKHRPQRDIKQPNVPVERQQIDLNDRRKDSQLSAPTGLLCGFSARV